MNKIKNKELFIELRKQGKTCREIAIEFNTNPNYISQITSGFFERNRKVVSDKFRIYIKGVHKEQFTKKQKERNSKLKQKILTYYGNGKLACVKCGFNDIRALSVDHINGNGRDHRGKNLYEWIRQNNYPKGFQTLCMNCQWIKRVENNETRKFLIDDNDIEDNSKKYYIGRVVRLLKDRVKKLNKNIKENENKGNKVILENRNNRKSKYDCLLPQIVELAKQEIEFKEIAKQLNIPVRRFWDKRFVNRIIELANKPN